MACSSRQLLEEVINEVERKESILGKDRRQTMGSGPTAKSSPIEFGSLAFEVPEEPMVLRNLKATMKAAKIASSQVVDKSAPNSSKLGYKNVSLWSSRSTTLEQQLRSILPINGLESWPDYETVSQIISSSSSRSDFDISEVVKPDLPMYDTLIVRLEEATEVRYGFDRLFSQWSYTSGRFELQKEWVDKIELDILVLSLVNDHYANLQLKKEQDSIAAQLKDARSTTVPVNIAQSVISAPVFNYSPRRKVLSEGECRTQALLRAVCPDGSTHIRPLCTSGDVLLALHELLDPAIFLHGCVQLPHVLTDIYERHTEGFYRYIYEMNGLGCWQYLKIALPSALQSLQPFVYPSAAHSSTFIVENIAADKVPADLRTASIDMIKRVRKHFGKQHMLSKLVVDFEACIEAATKVYLGKQRGLKRNKFPRGAHNCVKSDSAGQSAAKTDLATSLHTGTQGAPVGAIAAVVAGTSANSSSGSHESTKGVPAPHSIVDINDSPVKFRYRLLHIAETAFLDCLVGQRRDAVCFLEPAAKMYLRNFESYFHDQWSLLERQRVHDRAESFMSRQGGGKSSPATVPLLETGAGGGAPTPLSIDISTAGSFKGGTSSTKGSSRTTTLRVGFVGNVSSSVGVNSTNSATSSPTKRDASPINFGGGSGQNNYISDMFSPRSKNLAKLSTLGGKGKDSGRDRDEIETDAAKLAAKLLARQLFDKRYASKVVVSKSGKSRKFASDMDDSSDNSDSGGDEGVGGGGGDSDDGSNSAEESGADSDMDDSDQNEETFDPSQTVFRLKSYYAATGKPLPQPVLKQRGAMLRPNRETFLVGAGGSHAFATARNNLTTAGAPARPESGGADILRTTTSAEASAVPRPSLLVPKAPHGQRHLSRRVSVANATAVGAGAASGGGATATTRQKSPQLTHRKSRTSIMVGSQDRQILARYHISESHRVENERRKAEDERIRMETAAKLAAENAAAEARRKSSLYSLYFVTRTFFKRPDSSGTARAKTPQSPTQVAATTPTAAAASARGNSAEEANAATAEEEERVQQQRAVDRYNRRPSVVAATVARNARRKGRRGATQALNVANMTEAEAERIFAQDQTRYREMMDHAALEFLQQSLSSPNGGGGGQGGKNVKNRGGVAVDRDVYLAVDELLHRSASPAKGGGGREGGALSPSKMYEEMNKTPNVPVPAQVVGKRSKVRNDVEFDERAYKLAEKIDLTYLVSSFDPANHSRDKRILLDEDNDDDDERKEDDLEANSLVSETSTAAAVTTANEEASLPQATTKDAVDAVSDKPTLSEAELKKKKAKEYTEYMKKVYDEEMSHMLDSLIDHLPTQLASKVRKALAAKKHRLKMKKRQAYINRRRKVEVINNVDLNVLQKFYEGQTFLPGDCMTDSSSDDDEVHRKAKQAEMDKMLGDLAQVGSEEMAAMLEARAAEEAAEKAAQEAAEAKRLLREAAEAERREKKRQAKASRLAAQAEAAALAAANAAKFAVDSEGASSAAAVEATADVENVAAPAAAERRGSIAQMRRTFRTFSLMHITKVLLDGTLVPKVEDAVELPPSGVSRIGTATTPGAETTVSDAEPAGADSGGDSDDEEVAAGRYSSRPVTAVIMKFNDSGVLGSVTDAQGGDVHAMEAGEALEDSGSDMRPGTGEGGRPTSRAVSRPSTRSKMWDLPPLGRASSPFATSSPMASAPRTAGALFEAPLNVLASANCDAIAEVSEVPSEATGAECREELFSHELPYLSPTRASTKKLVGPESFAEVNSECPQGSAALIAATESLKVLDPADEKVAYQPSLLDNPESDFSQSNSVDLDVLGLLSDLQFARKLSVPPPTDTFVHKRSSRSVLKVVDGRPPSGLLFNMVKPGTPAGNVPLPCSASKGSPMDKITRAKEFPKTPFSKQLKKPAKIVNSSDATASAEKHASNPEAANLVQKQAVPPAPASLQLPPARPKGLYILPGTTTVASFAQKPPTQLKPSRQIVYSTRVLMQQKLREYINSPAAAADGLIATGGMDAYFVAGREGGFPGFNSQKDSTDSDLHYQIGSNLLEFSDNLPPSTADNVATDISSFGEEAILFPPMNAFEDARIPTAEKERADMHSAWTAPTVSSEKAPAPSSAPAAGNGGDVGGECSASARNVMPPPAISDSESDDCGAGVGVGAGDLQLSMAEWNLILDAAREQAAGLNLDILQQTELEDQCTVAGAESVDEDFEGNLIDEGMSAFAIPLSSLRDYYCDPLGTQENAYMLNEGPTPLLTVGKAIKLYSNGEDCTSAPMWCYTETTSDNAASAAQTEECNSVEVQSAATVVPKLATIGVASFNLYARTSHTAQHQQTGNLFEPAAAVEESVLEKFLKTAGVTPIISSNNAARPTSSHRKRSPVQGGLDPNLEESLRPTTPLRVTTPSKGRHKHSNFLDSEVERAAGKKIVPPLQGKVYFDDEEPAAANFPPLMIVKLVKPVVPVRVPDKSPPRHHYSQTIIPAGEAVEAAEASREAAKSRNPKAIVVSVPSLVVQEDEHSIV